VKNSLKILALTLPAGLLTFLMQFREEFLKAPRVRVGPLVRMVTEPAVASGQNQELAQAQDQARDHRYVRLFVLGDTGTGNESQYRVAQAMEARCREVGIVHGILLLGDNGYQAGFQSTDDPDWERKVNTPYGSPCLANLPIYPILGNHDYKGKPEVQIEYSLINPRWQMPNRFYSLYFSDLVRLVAIDSQTSDYCTIPAFCSVDFLFDQTKSELKQMVLFPEETSLTKQDLTNVPKWTVVMGHHPLKSASEHGYNHSGSALGWLYQKIFCDRVDIWLAGHAHHMEHRLFPGCRMEHYVLGGGGASLYGVKSGEEGVVFAESTFGFAEFTIEDQKIETRFFNQQGRLIYNYSKIRGESQK
jgi:tartrate-resistant acid phosphatase type 5